MNIGIDIDDTLLDTTKDMQENIEIYDKSGDVIKHIEEIMSGATPTENVRKFFSKYSIKISGGLKVKDNAIEVIERLKKEGHKIIIITARADSQCKGYEKATIKYLEKNNIYYDKIFFNALDKSKICTENNIDLMVDDSIKHCESVREVGIETILFTSIVNQDKETDIKRVSNWMELEKEINKLKEKQTV